MSVDYLRLSITDRCSLRCFYCQPRLGMVHSPREAILRTEEIIRLVQLLAGEGITRVRFTGGEPLERRDLIDLVKQVRQIPGIKDIALTSNGLRLPLMARDLYEAGVNRVNLSLDSLTQEGFTRICGRSGPPPLDSLHAALETGFSPIKVNTVILRGVNEGEWETMAELTRSLPIAWRFIERMSMGAGDVSDTFLAADELRQRLDTRFGLEPLSPASQPFGGGPARYWQIPGALGQIGFITPVSHNFCGECNRIRLTADGHLRACLLDGRETDLCTPLRTGANDQTLQNLIQGLIAAKPTAENRKMDERPMFRIGG